MECSTLQGTREAGQDDQHQRAADRRTTNEGDRARARERDDKGAAGAPGAERVADEDPCDGGERRSREEQPVHSDGDTVGEVGETLLADPADLA